MNRNGSEKNLASYSWQGQDFQRRENIDKALMEMEGGRGFSELLRNTSEEVFLNTLMENPIGISAPSMEMLGFKNITQSFRGDSEELFNSWLTNGEVPGYNSANIATRTRLSSRRISSELAPGPQNGITFQNRNSNDNLFQHSASRIAESSKDSNQHSLRNAAEKGTEASNLYLAKAWFHSSQPMTRSRSSELRRRYAAMQNFQTATISEAPDMNRMKQEFNQSSNPCDMLIGEMPQQLQTFMSPSTSSTSAFNTPMANVDNVSSVVNMLKGALERKKLGTLVDKDTMEGSSFSFCNTQEIPVNISSDQNATNQALESPGYFPGVFSVQQQDPGNVISVQRSLELNMEGFVTQANQIQMRTLSQEPSQSGSSAAAPALSTGFEVCDGPAVSGQALSVCESSRKTIGNGTSSNASKSREYRDRILENNLKDERKKGNLARVGSLSSGGSVDKGDPTKKRRVERTRKMQEAKERSSTPTLPSDMQSVLKRCENLEKEVRSLKLNLSFMNRKDSEQTKQIEELQKQNDELSDEKERLLEEIERIVSESAKM